MDEIEKTAPFFYGDNEIRPWALRDVMPELIADALDEYLYKQIEILPSHPSYSAAYKDNFKLWNMILTSNDHFQGMPVRLQGFHLTEWLPSSPGRYFTQDAQESRQQARKYLDEKIGVYSPDGKRFMILGGIGSVRLAANLSNNTYFLGATSTGITYQGIPVILHEKHYFQVIRIIKRYGGCLANLVGKLQIFPPDRRLIGYPEKIERYYLALNSVEVIRPSMNGELVSAAAILFQQSERNKSWSYCSFNPNPESKDNGLDKAIDWLTNYIKRYTRYKQIKILTDFDELSQHFNFPIELPLSKRPSSEEIQQVIEGYASILNIDDNRAVIIANNYSSGSQPIIVNNEGSVTMNSSRTPQNPWLSGSYYLVVFLAVIGAICVAGKLLSLWVLPVVIIGAIVALSVIGAFQLRQDEKLSRENFIELMGISLRTLAFIKPPSRKTNESNESTPPPEEPNSPSH